MLACLAAARARASRVGLSWRWRHVSPRRCVVLVNGNSRTIDLLGYRLERDLPLIAEGCAVAGVAPAKRAHLGRGVVDMMLRGRHTDQEGCMVLHGVTRTRYFYPPYDYECPTSPRLHARLSITEGLLVAWAFDEVAPEILLEELHTACELILEELINKRSKRRAFAELVTSAEQAGLLRTSINGTSTAQLLIELKDLRKNVRHRAAEGAGPWLAEHGEDIAICLERLVQHVT